ncbi:MAG TPA: hypothetical protein HA254_07720 [Candidatus Diapherotrites archaeon]|uniref:Uncharacterized protein n=1 Tax=Candidatus Iainarchaeum sp. TaxID=3101447 RepID=A0A7J4J051_9ARCH|nr:hypothetical protein [Candidatus Diapherotrites archaeon]
MGFEVTAIALGKGNAKKEMVKFSFGFVILSMLPLIVILVFSLSMAVRFGALSTEQALICLLAALAVCYFALPRMAGSVLKSIFSVSAAKKIGSGRV